MMRRICILTTSYPGYKGHVQSPFIEQFSRSFSRAGCTVHVIAPMYRDSIHAEEHDSTFHVHRFTYFIRSLQTLTERGGIPSNIKKPLIGWAQGFFFLTSMFFRAIPSVRQSDVIHAQWILPGLIGVPLKKLFKKPLIITERGASLNTALKSTLMKKLVFFIFHHADLLCANNKSQAEMIRKLGFSCVFIPNGIDTTIFTPRSKNVVRKKLHLSPAKKYILFTGWFIERKRVDTLIRAMHLLAQKRNDAELLLVGTGILEKDLQKLARELGVTPSIHFVGAIPPEHIGSWYNAADVMVLPSSSEGRPNVVAEAMASGTPVIATNIPGTDEFITHNDNGFLFPVGDHQALADHLLHLLDDPFLQQQFIQRSLSRTQGLTWEVCAQHYLRQYETLLTKKPSLQDISNKNSSVKRKL